MAPQTPDRDSASPTAQRRRPHRGWSLVVEALFGWMTLGWLGWTAWRRAKRDLAEMAAGERDSSGQGVTRAALALGSACVFAHLIFLIFAGGGVVAFLLTAGPCAESEGCRIDGTCQPSRKSTVWAKVMGRLGHPMGWACVARRNRDCRKSHICKTSGCCTAQSGGCWATRDADCRASAGCREQGDCHINKTLDGHPIECSPKNDLDCKRSDACRNHGKCRRTSDCDPLGGCDNYMYSKCVEVDPWRDIGVHEREP